MSSIEIRHVETSADLLALRADVEFHRGQLAVLTYPTAAPVGYLSAENPKCFGTAVVPGPGVAVRRRTDGGIEVVR